MPVPHDYYDFGSDEPHLHNRDHARSYVEPDWQAHAAGHQLPVLSTIGRGPQGDGLLVANFENNGTSFSFDIISDVTGEPIATIGPIPSGRVKVDVANGKIIFTTNKLGPNNTIAKDVVSVDVPQGEDGSRIYMYPDKITRTSSDMYTVEGSKLTAYNRRGYTKRPDVRVGDVVIGQVYDDDDGYLFFGTVADATAQEQLVVIAQTIIPIAALVGPKGDKGDKGNKGDTGAKGDPGTNGMNGVSCTHEWNGTTLTVTSASGTSSADLKGDTGATGATGADGKSAYQIAVDNGYRGSQADWLASLKGPKGDEGSIGPTGPTGPQGPAGASPKYKIVRCVLDLEQFASTDWVSNACSKTYNLPTTAPSGYQPLGVIGTVVEQPAGVIVTGAYLTADLRDRKLVVNYYKTPTYSGQGDVGWEIDVLYVETGQLSSIQQGAVTSVS